MPPAEIESINDDRRPTEFAARNDKYEAAIVRGPHFGPVMPWRLPDAVKRNTFFDFWVTDKNKYEVYLSEPHKKGRLTRTDYHPERKIGVGQNGMVQWDLVGEWTCPWAGPFYVTAKGDARYFVSDAGRVYGVPKAGKPLAPLVELWNGPPVEALIHDADKSTWFAFTANQYFEVADPIVPKPHAMIVRRSWAAEVALETAAKCGRVIRGLPEPKAKRP